MKKWQHCEVSFLVKDILIEALGMWLFLDELEPVADTATEEGTRETIRGDQPKEAWIKAW